MGLKTRIEKITPSKAATYLETNRDNRPLRKNEVQRYVNLIKNGEFLNDGNAIKFDEEDNLLDGQHRLHAIVLAGEAVEMVTIRGLSTAARNVLDTGRGRTWSDALYMAGEKNYTVLSSSLNLLHHYLYDDPPMCFLYNRYYRMSHPQMFELLEEHSGIRESTDYIVRVPNLRRVMRLVPASFCHYLFAMSHDNMNDVNNFFISLASGAALEEGTPIIALRDRIIAYAQNKRSLKSIDVAAWTIIAWNKMQQGKTATYIRWKRDKKLQNFPIVINTK